MRLETVRAAGIDWAVRVLGAGPPVLLLHGFPENADSWRHNQREIAAAGHTVYVPDLKGYGRTAKPKPGSPCGDYRVSTMSREVGQLIDALGYESMDVVGHDWGGILLSAMTRTCRSRIGRAVLVNAPYRKLVPWAPRHVAFFNLPSIPERRFWRDPIGFVGGIFDHWSRVRSACTPDDLHGFARALQRDGSITCAFAYYRSLKKDAAFLSRAVLQKPHAPPPEALVLFGAEDPIMPPWVAQMAHRDLPGSQLILVPEAGHFVHSEAPEAFNRAVIEFLSQGVSG